MGAYFCRAVDHYPEYPAMLQSMGRYLALGLIAGYPLPRLGRVRLRQLARRDWLTALMLTTMGNLIYYFCLASAIQRTGARLFPR